MKNLGSLLLIAMILISCEFNNPIKEGDDCDKGEFQAFESEGNARMISLDSSQAKVSIRYYEKQSDGYAFINEIKDLNWPQESAFPKSTKDSFSLKIQQYGHWYGSCGFQVDSSRIMLIKEQLSP